MLGNGKKKQAESSIKKRLKSISARMMEIIVTLLLVLLFFSGFLGLLNMFFPTGTSFKQLIGRQASHEREMLQGPTLPLPELGISSEEVEYEDMTAFLSKTWNKVKSKRSFSIAWGPAETGMELYDKDAVQTFGSSRAQITFDEDNYLSMGSNSLVIIKRLEKDPVFNNRRSFMVMMEGELSGKISAKNQKAVQMEITMPDAVARFKPSKGKGKEAEFKISVDPGKSSNVVVYGGTAEVIAQGKTVTVKANHGVRILPGDAPHPIIVLPPPPKPISPSKKSVMAYRNVPPAVHFSWSAPPEIQEFRFTLARTPDFSEIMADEIVSQPGFSHGNLKNGTYYWRVSSLRLGCEGKQSPVKEVKMVQDSEPPLLQVDLPGETVNQDLLLVKGETEPGAQVFVSQEKITPSAGGSFSLELPLRLGLNNITVEAMDQAGNVSYESYIVQRQF